MTKPTVMALAIERIRPAGRLAPIGHGGNNESERSGFFRFRLNASKSVAVSGEPIEILTTGEAPRGRSCLLTQVSPRAGAKLDCARFSAVASRLRLKLECRRMPTPIQNRLLRPI
jgi:hypothetical protein